jgi:hypothetical protein
MAGATFLKGRSMAVRPTSKQLIQKEKLVRERMA